MSMLIITIMSYAYRSATNALNVDAADVRPYAIVVDGAALNICLHRYEQEFADVR